MKKYHAIINRKDDTDYMQKIHTKLLIILMIFSEFQVFTIQKSGQLHILFSNHIASIMGCEFHAYGVVHICPLRMMSNLLYDETTLYHPGLGCREILKNKGFNQSIILLFSCHHLQITR